MPMTTRARGGARTGRAVFFAATLLSGLGAGARGAAAPPPDFLETLSMARHRLSAVQDYTAVFYKQQRVGGVLQPEEKILFKFKRPFMVYMKWIGDAHSGREALFVKGKHGDKLLVHPGGMANYFAPTAALDPNGMLAMRNNLRPITESGMEAMINLIAEACELARQRGDLVVRYCGTSRLDGRAVHRFERFLPADKGYPARMTTFEMDSETGYPLLVSSYGWEGEVLERYRYENFRTDVGLTDKDFDRGNRAYGFGRLTARIP